MEQPRNMVLVVGSNYTIRKAHIENMLQGQPSHWLKSDGWDKCSLNLHTKYYDAQIVLYTGKEASLEDSQRVNSQGPFTDGILIVMNESEDCSVLKTWQDFITKHNPSIRVIITPNEPSLQSEPGKTIRSWCFDNGFEIVPLHVDGSQESSKEKYGLDRVIEALSANMWENMAYKTTARPIQDDAPAQGSTGDYKPPDSNDATVDSLFAGLSLNSGDEPATTSSIPENPFLPNDFFMGLDSTEGFEQAFGKLRALKEQTKSMSDKDRREAASRVTLALLRGLAEMEEAETERELAETKEETTKQTEPDNSEDQ